MPEHGVPEAEEVRKYKDDNAKDSSPDTELSPCSADNQARQRSSSKRGREVSDQTTLSAS